MDCELGEMATEKLGCETAFVDEAYDQPKISWIAVVPPVAAVKPAYAVLDPIVVGMSIGHEMLDVFAGLVTSVTVIAKVVPS